MPPPQRGQPQSPQALSGLCSSGTPPLVGWPGYTGREGIPLRTTENLSLRLDPELVRLARRTAAECQLNLREFFEDAIRRQVVAMTEPEYRSNLLSSVEESFLRRLDERMKDVLERVAALGAKEAADQAHTLQIVKRVLWLVTQDKSKVHKVIDQAWDEAVDRVRKRGRAYPPEVVQDLESQVAEREKKLEEGASEMAGLREQLQRAWMDMNRAEMEAKRLQDELYRQEGESRRLAAQLERERWVAERLDKQGMNPIGRKAAADLRREYMEAEGKGGAF